MGTGLATAKTNKSLRTKSVVICAVLLVLVIMGIALAAFNLFKAITDGTASRWLFVLGYLLGVTLATMYIMISMNTVFTTLLTTDKRYLIMKRWDNGLVAYNIENRIPIIKEFMPAKAEVLKVPIKEISHICIGTKNFIKRNATGSEFIDTLTRVEKSSPSGKRNAGRIDIIYVETVNNECAFMSINNFDSKAVIKILQSVRRSNPEIEIMSGSRIYRKAI